MIHLLKTIFQRTSRSTTTMASETPAVTNLSASPMPSPSLAEVDNPLEEEDDEAEIPLTMAASAVLADLPGDVTAALEKAGTFSQEKVVIKFKPVGSAPSLTQDVCKITSSRRFEEVVRYLRKKLRCKDTDSVFLYINSAFAPSLDEVVGNLHQCFKNAHDQLVVVYSMTPAFG